MGTERCRAANDFEQILRSERNRSMGKFVDPLLLLPDYLI